MRLYAIKRRSDGKFYVAAQGHYSIHTGKPEYIFATQPSQFLKTPDGVARNLRKLCSTPFWDTEPPRGVCVAVAARWKEVAWRNFDAGKLDLYEIVIMDVNVISMTATPAREFAQIDAIENAPLRKRERVEAGGAA